MHGEPRGGRGGGGRRSAGGHEPLVRALLESLPSDDLAAGPNDVVLDVEVDGFRCVILVAPHVQTSHAHTLLSPREQEIARMVAEGYPNKTIAAVLDISSWTVSTHLRRIFAKLGVRTRAAMVARVVEDGLAAEPRARQL
jgi:DNA-binding CsgD family transcriptional regulator